MTAAATACPDCGSLSTRVEDGYRICANRSCGRLVRKEPTQAANGHTPPPVEVPQPRAFTWRTASQIGSEEPESAERIAPYIYRKVITEIAGKIKVGKTSYYMDGISAIVHGRRWLGIPTTQVPVEILTEERPATFRAVLDRFGLLHSNDVHVLYRHEAAGVEWPEIVAEAHRHAIAVGAGLLVVDTLPDWAGIAGDAENNAGAAMEAMRPLGAVAAAGLAILVIRHDRKSGGELGDSARGSSAFGGAADVLVSLRRVDGQGHETRRTVLAVGRFDDIPSQLVIDLRDGHYVALGDAADIERREVRATVLDVIPMTPDKAMTEATILERLGDKGSRSTLQRVLQQLGDEGLVSRDKCAGPSGRAFGYWLTTLHTEEKPTLGLGVGHNDKPNPPLPWAEEGHQDTVPGGTGVQPNPLSIDGHNDERGACHICGSDSGLSFTPDDRLVCEEHA